MAQPPPPDPAYPFAPPPPPPLDTLPPDWVAEDKGPAIIATMVTVVSIATLFTAGRLYVRGWMKGKFQLDDYIIALALLCSWTAVAFGIKASLMGNGKHFLILTTEQKSNAILWTIAGFAPGVFAFGLPKLAVVHLLTRLLNPSRLHKVFLWFLAGLCMLSLVGCVGLLFGQCQPVRSQWDFTVEPQCLSKMVLVWFAVYTGSLSAAVDLYLAIYPAVVLFSLQMAFRKKLALSAALGIGSIATIFAIYKTIRLPLLASEDFSYDTSDLVIWTCIEASTLIIASSIPILQPLAEKILNRTVFGSSYRSRNPNDYKKYGSGKNQPPSDVELSYQSRKRTVKDPNGLTFLDQTRGGSEESILAGKDRGTKVSTEPRSMSPGSRRIMVMDEVNVSYSAQNQQNLDGFHQQTQRPF